MTPTAPPPRARRRLPPTVLVVGVVAAIATIVRVWSVLTVPLAVSPDGGEYLTWALRFWDGQAMDLPNFRTPGYPVFLAAAFRIMGAGPYAVLIAQHALALLACLAIAAVPCRLADGHRWGYTLGLALGTLAAIDPWYLAFSSYALTESLSASLFVITVAVALLARRPRVVWGVVLGILLGLCCLTRPPFQFMVPFVAAGWVLSVAPRFRNAAAPALAVALAFAAVAGPWLVHNARRGTYGFGSATSVYIWFGAGQNGLLDLDYPRPEIIGAPYTPPQNPGHVGPLYAFKREVRALPRRDVQDALRDWTMHSLRKDPAGYARALGRTMLWQLNIYPAAAGVTRGETEWMMWRMAQPEPTMWLTTGTLTLGDRPPPVPLDRFRMDGTQSTLARVQAWAGKRLAGIPQAALFGVAVLAGLASLVRGRWSIALIILGTGAVYAVHVPLIMTFSRFSFAAWMSWYMMPAVLAAALFRTWVFAPATPGTEPDAR